MARARARAREDTWLAPDGGRQLVVMWRNIEALIPYARNARTHSDAQIAQIAGSIREFGFTNPVLIDFPRLGARAQHRAPDPLARNARTHSRGDTWLAPDGARQLVVMWRNIERLIP